MANKIIEIASFRNQQQQNKELAVAPGQSAGNQIEDNDQTSIANANWNDLIIDDQKEPRPFIVTTADGENALYALDWKEGRIEAEELWLVQATDREERLPKFRPS